VKPPARRRTRTAAKAPAAEPTAPVDDVTVDPAAGIVEPDPAVVPPKPRAPRKRRPAANSTSIEISSRAEPVPEEVVPVEAPATAAAKPAPRTRRAPRPKVTEPAEPAGETAAPDETDGSST
jgi:hypothetical protein